LLGEGGGHAGETQGVETLEGLLDQHGGPPGVRAA
jgi:hypothetical protein